MNRRYSTFFKLLLCGLFFTACSPAATAITQSAFAPQATEPVVPPPTSAPTYTSEVLTIDQLVESYMNGEIDNIGDLNSQELAEFSSKLTEKKNAERGIRPVIYNNEAYIDPITGMMKDYDGHPDMNETIEMFVPIAGKDADGNLQFKVNGQLVTIRGSADVDWNIQISDPNDTRINWPTDNVTTEGLSRSQYAVKWGGVIIPWVLLDTNLGQLYLGGVNAEVKPTFSCVKIETDSAGNPIYGKRIITFGVDIGLNEEGSDIYFEQPWRSWYEVQEEPPPFYQNLLGGQTYWMIAPSDQKGMYDGIKNTLDGYNNIVEVDNVWSVLTNQTEDDKNMLVVGIRFLIKIAN